MPITFKTPSIPSQRLACISYTLAGQRLKKLCPEKPYFLRDELKFLETCGSQGIPIQYLVDRIVKAREQVE